MMNENGEKLLQLCSINDLGIINTMHKHLSKRLYTIWCFPDGKTQNPIDFIIVPNDKRGSNIKYKI